MRLMAVSLTEDQVRNRTKTVTRRLGWWETKKGRRILKAGDRLQLCRKVMGRKRRDGTVEPLVRIVAVEVLDVRREPLNAITQAEVDAEGFPGHTPAWFIKFFCASHKGCTPATVVTRIRWRYLEGAA